MAAPIPLHSVTGEPLGVRVRRLQAEARDAACEHLALFVRHVHELAVLAMEVSDGGEAYPPGVRDAARRLAEDLDRRGLLLQSLAEKAQ